jgi:hypothetical protein
MPVYQSHQNSLYTSPTRRPITAGYSNHTGVAGSYDYGSSAALRSKEPSIERVPSYRHYDKHATTGYHHTGASGGSSSNRRPSTTATYSNYPSQMSSKTIRSALEEIS